MIKAEIKTKLNLPKVFITQEDLNFIVQRILIPNMQKDIHAQKAINGGRLPRNEPETIKRKGDDRSLIETGALLGSFIFEQQGKNKVVVTLGSERKDIGKHLQIDGIKTNKGIKYYRFFGISRESEAQIVKYAKDLIIKVIERKRNAG